MTMRHIPSTPSPDDPAICGFTWQAPAWASPNELNNWKPQLIRIEQTCALTKGHDGQHRSSGNVTAETR